MTCHRITPLHEADYEPWLALWSAYQRFYAIDLSTDVTGLTWTRLHDGRIHGLGARDATGRLLGIIHFLFHEDTWSAKQACYISDLFVEPAARGSGCAKMLIHAVAAAASATGAAPPYWLTHESNAAARRLYERLGKNHGFIQYAYLPIDPDTV